MVMSNGFRQEEEWQKGGWQKNERQEEEKQKRKGLQVT
jgi:hypothetical protein